MTRTPIEAIVEADLGLTLIGGPVGPAGPAVLALGPDAQLSVDHLDTTRHLALELEDGVADWLVRVVGRSAFDALSARAAGPVACVPGPAFAPLARLALLDVARGIRIDHRGPPQALWAIERLALLARADVPVLSVEPADLELAAAFTVDVLPGALLSLAGERLLDDLRTAAVLLPSLHGRAGELAERLDELSGNTLDLTGLDRAERPGRVLRAPPDELRVAGRSLALDVPLHWIDDQPVSISRAGAEGPVVFTVPFSAAVGEDAELWVRAWRPQDRAVVALQRLATAHDHPLRASARLAVPLDVTLDALVFEVVPTARAPLLPRATRALRHALDAARFAAAADRLGLDRSAAGRWAAAGRHLEAIDEDAGAPGAWTSEAQARERDARKRSSDAQRAAEIDRALADRPPAAPYGPAPDPFLAELHDASALEPPDS